VAQGEQAVSMGGIFAVSTVLQGKVQHLAFHLKTINRFGPDGVLNHGLQILGCLMLLSAPCWHTHPTTGTRCWYMSLVC
jgi:hypothetical protein